MIARELLVKLGFDIDEEKFNRFNKNVDDLKNRMERIKSKFELNVETREGLNNLKTVSNRISEIRDKIDQHKIKPQVDLRSLQNYQKELAKLGKKEHDEVLELNKQEKIANRERIKAYQEQIQQLNRVKAKLAENQRQWKAAVVAAKSANLTFSRYFNRFALAGSASFFLTLRKTLQDVKDFRSGAGKTTSVFSRDQLNTVIQFNHSLERTKNTLNNIRNSFAIDLMPALKGTLDKFNHWLSTNRKLIQQKLKDFVETLAKSFSTLGRVLSGVFSVLNPLVNLIGGWSSVLSGVVGLGVLSWIVRLGVFLRTGAAAVLFFSGAIKTLTVSLMTNPLCLLLMAIVAAVVLIADEFMVTARGGDSLMNRFEGLKKIGDKFVETLKAIWGWLIKVKNNMVSFTFGGGAKNMFNNVVEDAKKAASGISDIFTNAFGGTNAPTIQPTLNNDAINAQLKEFQGLNMSLAKENRHRLYADAERAVNHNKKVEINNKQPITINISAGSDIDSHEVARVVENKIKDALDMQSVELSAAIGAV